VAGLPKPQIGLLGLPNVQIGLRGLRIGDFPRGVLWEIGLRLGLLVGLRIGLLRGLRIGLLEGLRSLRFGLLVRPWRLLFGLLLGLFIGLRGLFVVLRGLRFGVLLYSESGVKFLSNPSSS
jgi:hypothetical protein